MLEAAREKAQAVLLDRTLFALDAKQSKAFEALMKPLTLMLGLRLAA